MSLEHMIAAMSCMISTCGDNFTPTLLKNSIIANPLDDVWNGICRKQASEFDQKFAHLLKSQQKAFNVLDSIEKSLNSLRTLATQSGDVKKVNKREESKYLDLLAGPRFDCNGSVTGIPSEYEYPFGRNRDNKYSSFGRRGRYEYSSCVAKKSKNEYPSFEVECQHIKYGSNWLLIVFLDTTNRKWFRNSGEKRFVHGFNFFKNATNLNSNQYFIGSQALNPIIRSNTIEEVLIVLYDAKDGIEDVISSEYLNDQKHSEKRSQMLNDFKGIDIVSLCQVAFADILAYEEVHLVDIPRFAIFVKGNIQYTLESETIEHLFC